MNRISIQDIDGALTAAPGRFTVREIAAALGGAEDDELLRRIEREVESDEAFFNNGDGNCRKRADFFNGLEFAITPDEEEIAQGVLFPANRFAPLVPEEVFSSETTLLEGNTPVKTREIIAPLGKIFHYCTLLGSEQILDFLLAESPANAKLRNRADSSTPVTLTIFDLSEFYREHDFACGDALRCRIEDYRRGVFSFEYLAGSDRSARRRQEWLEAFETGLEKVFDRFEDYLEIPEQLAWAFYCAPETVRQADCSLDEFTAGSVRLEIRADGDHAVLAFRRPEAESEAEDASIPDGVGISTGETGDFASMLREVGSPLAPVEVESFMIDNYHARDLDFDHVFSRAFGHGELKYSDEAQEAVFMNHLEERFEELTGNYNREDDEPKAELRETILGLVEERLDFFEFAAAAKEVEKLRHDEFRKLSEIAMQLREILGMLNDGGFTPDEKELDRLREIIEARADDQEKSIEILEAHLQEKHQP